MKPNGLAVWFQLIALSVVLNACSGVAVREPDIGNQAACQERAGKIASISEWGFAGKISLDDGESGGSGRLQWNVGPGGSELDFHAAMGRGAWHLEIGPEGALLRQANGSTEYAPNVNELIQERIGWAIPVHDLQWWVRGLAAPGAVESETCDPKGLLTRLEQSGWNVDFDRYTVASGMVMPARLDAKHDAYRVKLAISRWWLGSGTRKP